MGASAGLSPSGKSSAGGLLDVDTLVLAAGAGLTTHSPPVEPAFEERGEPLDGARA